MTKIEKSSFQHSIRNHASFIRSSSLSGSRKDKSNQILATREIMFGFNQKKDNQVKTHQLTLNFKS